VLWLRVFACSINGRDGRSFAQSEWARLSQRGQRCSEPQRKEESDCFDVPHFPGNIGPLFFRLLARHTQESQHCPDAIAFAVIQHSDVISRTSMGMSGHTTQITNAREMQLSYPTLVHSQKLYSHSFKAYVSRMYPRNSLSLGTAPPKSGFKRVGTQSRELGLQVQRYCQSLRRTQHTGSGHQI